MSIPAWGHPLRIVFRFVFVYLLLHALPFPLDSLPMGSIITEPCTNLWTTIITWAGGAVFNVTITVLPNGSGDTTYNYVQVFCFLVIAVTVTIIWTILDWKRPNYRQLHDWMRLYIRFVLGAAMMIYGAVKVIPSQFPGLTSADLMQPVGTMSPMGMLWKFMSTSSSYTIFTGVGEMLAGLLLTIRRTTLLGALFSIVILANVVILNFSYDVPVKLYSMHLLFMAFFLVAPDVQRLSNLFLFNRRVDPVALPPRFSRRWPERTAIILRTFLVISFAAWLLDDSQDVRQLYRESSSSVDLYRTWDVMEFEINGNDRLPNASQWKRFEFDGLDTLDIQCADGSRLRYAVTLPPDTSLIIFDGGNGATERSVLAYTLIEPWMVELEGVLEGQRVRATLQNADTLQYRLVTRGSRWINEYPYNR